MVSLWPFRGDGNDAATFEKTLSSLSNKITKASSRNDSLRQQARRIRVGWVLAGGFTYIVLVLILTLVTGWHEWGAPAYSIVAGGPPLLYIVHITIITYYNWRIESSQSYLDGLYKQRDATIEKLKKATKYDSTQQLLDKYGSPRPSPKQKSGKQTSPKRGPEGPPEQRVFRQPPPTANIRRDQPNPHAPATPPGRQQLQQQQQRNPASPPHNPPSAGEEFAPNAFADPSPQQYAPAAGAAAARSRWYDHIIDALLGDDETSVRNRVALICQSCRLVNGQAPPGARTPEELGRWRCGACGAWNGVESEAERAMRQLAEHGDVPVPMSPVGVAPQHAGEGGGEGDGDGEAAEAEDGEGSPDDAVVVARASEDEQPDEPDTPARSLRSRKGGKAGKGK